MSPVDGVVLAAGLSTRNPDFKLTLPLGGRTVIERAVAGMAAWVQRVYVVVGWNADLVAAALAALDRVELVYNEHFREGMLSSIQAGLGRVRGGRAFLLPGDMPLVGGEVYERMLQASGEIVVPTCEGQTGHPVLLSAKRIPEILALPPEATLRDYISAQGPTRLEVGSPGILVDVDTPAAYAAACEQFAATCAGERGREAKAVDE